MGSRFQRSLTIVLFFGLLFCYCSAYEDAESVFNYCQNKCKPRTTPSSDQTTNGGESERSEQLIFECMTDQLNRYPPDQRQDIRSQWTKSPRFKNAVRKCRKSQQPELQCDPNSPYRTHDGSCNNIRHPTWGETGDCVQRLCEFNYNGTHGVPLSCNGNPKPSPRKLSAKIFYGQAEDSRIWTMLLPIFGQFVSHDISNSAPEPGTSPECCPFCKGKKFSNCYPFKVEEDDPFYGEFGVRCLSVLRSPPCNKCSLGKRQHTNTVTTCLDASTVYGSSAELAAELRAWDGTGKLLTESGDLLPSNNNPDEPFCPRDQTSKCFLAGDSRVNQHSGVMSMQTIFMREHNSVAEKLKVLNPHWDDDRLYEEARRIVIAKLQCITYRELLIILVLPELQLKYGLLVGIGGLGTKYDPKVRLGAFAEFSTGAYRLHNIVGHYTGYANQPVFRDLFSNWRVLRDGNMTQLLDGLQHTPSASFFKKVVIDLNGQLEALPGEKFGKDLASIDIARGREQGLASYVKILELCSKQKVKTFEDLNTVISQENIQLLKESYECVGDIDAWVGIMIENIRLPTAMGPTASCVIGLQFKNLKYGDRFYFEHEGESGSFTKGQRAALQNTLLARILCDHTGIQWVRVQPLLRNNPFLPCALIPPVDLNPWRD